MKKKLLTITTALTLMISSLPALAGEKIEVKVKGMVCSFCAQGIKKKFSALDAVKKTEVNLDDKWVKLEVADDKTLSDDQIKTSIKDAGYEVVTIERTK